MLFLAKDADERGYVARALGHSIFTEADTWDELKAAIRDAVQCHFDEGDLVDWRKGYPAQNSAQVPEGGPCGIVPAQAVHTSPRRRGRRA